MLLAAIFGLVAQATGIAGADSAHAIEEPKSPALIAATANKTSARTSPSLIKEPVYVRPSAALLAGEFGEVLISGIVGEDGKLYEPKINVSSLAASIDAAALAAVPSLLFEPARDANGKAISIPVNLSLEFGHVDFRGPNGVARYRCDQFVKDYDWWYRTWPADKKDRIFATLKGFVVIQELRSGNPANVDFDAEWKAAVEGCRKEPSKLMLQYLKPHGEFIRRMTER